jgi:hypothetical protein
MISLACPQLCGVIADTGGRLGYKHLVSLNSKFKHQNSSTKVFTTASKSDYTLHVFEYSQFVGQAELTMIASNARFANIKSHGNKSTYADR